MPRWIQLQSKPCSTQKGLVQCKSNEMGTKQHDVQEVMSCRSIRQYVLVDEEIDPHVVHSQQGHLLPPQLVQPGDAWSLPIEGMFSARRLHAFEPRPGTKLTLEELRRVEDLDLSDDNKDGEAEGSGIEILWDLACNDWDQ